MIVKSHEIPRCRQHGQDLDELNKRSGPAVNDEERKNSFPLRLDRVRLHVDEVDVQTVDACLELDEIISI